MQNFVDSIKLDLISEPWALQLIGVILLALFINILVEFLLKYLHKAAKFTNNNYDDALIDAAKSPLTAIIWIVAVKFCINIIDVYVKIFNINFVNSANRIAIILCFCS